MKKIICKLMGGLGNQLFIYSSARAYSIKHNIPIVIDVSSFGDGNDSFGRKYELDQFNLPFYIRKWPISNSNAVARFRKKLIERNTEDFDDIKKAEAACSHNFCLWGYNQDYKVFHQYRKIIRKELRLQVETSDNWKRAKKTIEEYTSVSIHLRFGDYIKMGWCVDEEYYKKAVSRIKDQINKMNLKFIIFTEDVNRAQTMLKDVINEEECLYVKKKYALSDVEEFWLMTKCTHHIISNSTFSWWSAYLSEDINAITIAPLIEDWIDSSWGDDYFPREWIRIPAIVRKDGICGNCQ